MKKLAIGAGIIIGMIVLILAALPFAIDLNRHKAAILEGIKSVTDRQVDFDGIRLSILTGLGAEITGLRIADDRAFSQGDFLTLKSAKVKVALLPLLKKEIRVRGVVLDEPKVSIIRDKDGVFNFTTLLLPKPEKTGEEEGGPGVLDKLMVGNVEVKNAAISYIDNKAKPGEAPFTVSDIDVESSDISLTRPIPFSLAAAVMSAKGQNLTMKGTIGPVPEGGGFGQAPIDVQVLLDSVSLASLPVKMPVSAGDMKVDMTAKGSLGDRVTSRLVVDLAGLVLGGKASKDRKGTSCSVAGDMDLDLGKQVLVLRNGTFTLGRDKGGFEGKVDHFKVKPSWNIMVHSDHITPDSIPLPAGLLPDKMTMSGPAGFRLVTRGSKESFEVKADMDMKPMVITFGTFFDKPANSPFNLSSTIVKKPELMEISTLDFDLGAVKARGSGEVRKAGDTSRFTVRIETNQVPLQTAQAIIPMLRSFKPSGSIVMKTTLNGGGGGPLDINVQALSEHMGLVLTKPKEGEQPKGKVLAGPITADMNGMTVSVDAVKKEKNLTAQGTMRSRGGTFANIPYTNLTGAFSLAGDQLRVKSFDLAALKGSIKGSASYNLKTKAWSADPVFNNVQAGSILDTMTSFKGVFAGTLSGDLKASGVAGAPALSNLGAKGKIGISKGEWRNFDLAGTVLSSLLGVPGASEIFGFAPAEVQKYNTTRFEAMNAEVDLAKKVITVDTMKLLNISSGKDVDTESSLKGTISMETNEVNLTGNVVLPKRFSQRIGNKAEAFSAIMNDQKRLVLPMTITGTVKKPVPMVEVKSLSSAFTKYYTSKALDKGMKKLQDKGQLPPGTEETRKALENVLDGLIKKK
ncbi:MAG TPA: AsmA family protein [Deltaproteobacteria bacterium]|nr:AsmA family protein [Deltaproteobacteria bacterium]